MSDESGVRVEPKTLLDGVVRALQEQVLPHVGSRTARGQLWAAIDVLRNLALRVEPLVGAFEQEADSAHGALATLAARARESGHEVLAAEIRSRLDAAPPAPASARACALRALLRDVFERLDGLPGDAGDALRPLLAGHLAAQVLRDLSRFQGSLLEEISRG